MLRRKFLRWIVGFGGGYFTVAAGTGVAPLLRINTALLTEARAQEPCGQDTCTISDVCQADSVGHTCQVRDVCDEDGSGDCTNDECTQDASLDCSGDRCISDASGSCTNDGGPACTDDQSCPADEVGCRDDYSGVCGSDSSGTCTNDSCGSDSSKECQSDICAADSSGSGDTDFCVADSSGGCQNDDCVSDKSGDCGNDLCLSDKSGQCTGDRCRSDSSGDCTNDGGPACIEDQSCPADEVGCRDDYSGVCSSDSSGSCTNDSCGSDSSKGCQSDICLADSSGDGSTDFCIADSSGQCDVDSCISDRSGSGNHDDCLSDSSGACTEDLCRSDSSGDCTGDRCRLDSSGICTEHDVCVRDASFPCASDLCRDDRSPADCAAKDTCALDLAGNGRSTGRRLARAGLSRTLHWLYGISSLALAVALGHGVARAAVVIDATDAVFFPDVTYATGQTVSVGAPVGPFLRDCDDDGSLEADTNGDGACSGDPEVDDFNGDGSRELPPATALSGNYEFTCFFIPDDVAIIVTGPLSVTASMEVAVFGVLRLASGADVSSSAMIDTRTSAWLSEDGSPINLTTGLVGTIDESDSGFDGREGVPPILYTSLCDTNGLCGDANSDGRITATDALAVLKNAVGLGVCSAAVCDVNSSGGVTATDALLVLQKAVGVAVTLDCP